MLAYMLVTPEQGHDQAVLLQVGDKIVSMKIVDGLQYLQQPAGAEQTASADTPITDSPAKS